MGSDQCFTRFNTLEIKSQIHQKIGHHRAETYFNHLGKFLTSRITKSEFDKLCIKTIGREHISLHNRLITSILKNASVAKSRHQHQSQSLYGGDSSPSPSPLFPRKCRSRKKFRDRPSPLGPLGKPQSITTTNDDDVRRLQIEEDGEEVEQSVKSRSSLTAPLGVSIAGGVKKKSFFRSSLCQVSGELPDTETLRVRLERKLEMEGMKLTMESANVLNSGLDVFMRRMMESCLSLASSKRVVSMLDFRAAMELNPRVLGEDWSIQLEKICSRGLEEE